MKKAVEEKSPTTINNRNGIGLMLICKTEVNKLRTSPGTY